MQAVAKSTRWVMVVSGLLTTTMITAAFDPEATLERIFGASFSGPLAEIVVRNWGVLITMVGVLLIYGALRPQYRRLALVVGIVSKLVFIGLVLSAGTEYLDAAFNALVIDAVSVVMFILFLGAPEGKDVQSGI